MKIGHLFFVIVFVTSALWGSAQTFTPAITGIIRADGAQLYLPTSIDIQDGFAYVGTMGSLGLEILNVQDPVHPIHVANILSDGYPNAVKVVGEYVYMACQGSLVTVSIKDKSHPIMADTKWYGTVSGQPHMVHDGNYLYVTIQNEFQVYSLADPGHPALIGKLTNTDPGVHDFQAIDVSGNYAYVTSAFDAALKVIDISDSAHPQQVGILHDGDGGAALQGGLDIIVRGNYAYIAAANSQAVEIVDVANASAPKHVVSVVSGQEGFAWSGPSHVALSGNNLYVAMNNSNTLLVIDVSSNLSPMVIGMLADGDGGARIIYPTDLIITGDNLFMTNSTSLETLNISNPISPAHVSIITNGAQGSGILLSGSQAIAVSGNYAFVISQGSQALEVVDISNPKIPTHHGSLQYPNIANALNCIVVSGNYAFVAGYGRLQVIDISTPANPSVITSLLDGDGGASILPNVTSLAISGNYAYITSSFPGTLEIIDITDPAHPAHKGNIVDGDGGATLGSPQRVAISGHYAYITDFFNSGLEVIDVANPAAPVHVAFFANGDGGADLNGAFGLAVSGNYAFVGAGFSNTLEIVDITTPASPVHAGKITNGDGGASIGFTLDVAASGNYVFVNGMEIIDVTNRSTPVHAGKLANPGFLTGGFTIVGNYAYVLEANGLGIVYLNAPAPPVAINAADVSATGFTANWSSVSGAIAYELDVSTTNFQTFVPGLQAKSVSSLTFAIAGLTPGLTYQFKVRVITAAGTSDNSNVIEATLPKADQTISFNHIDDVTVGDPDLQLTPTSSSGLPVVLSTTSTNILITDYRVHLSSAGRATVTANQTGDNSWNAAPAVTVTFCVKPLIPTVAVSDGTLTSSALSGNQWFLNSIEITGATATTFTPQESGNYTVQTHVDDCFSSASTAISFAVTGVAPSGERFSLYPNPAENYLYIKGAVDIEGPVEYYSSVGKSGVLVFTRTGDTWSTDVKQLSSGLYILRVIDHDGIRSEKFLKK